MYCGQRAVCKRAQFRTLDYFEVKEERKRRSRQYIQIFKLFLDNKINKTFTPLMGIGEVERKKGKRKRENVI